VNKKKKAFRFLFFALFQRKRKMGNFITQNQCKEKATATCSLTRSKSNPLENVLFRGTDRTTPVTTDTNKLPMGDYLRPPLGLEIPKDGLDASSLGPKYSDWAPWVPHLNAWAKKECPGSIYSECCDIGNQTALDLENPGVVKVTRSKGIVTQIDYCNCKKDDTECIDANCSDFNDKNTYYSMCKITNIEPSVKKDFVNTWTTLRPDCLDLCTTAAPTPTAKPSSPAAPMVTTPAPTNPPADNTAIIIGIVITLVLLMAMWAFVVISKRKKN
jgi:hypothetical protein